MNVLPLYYCPNCGREMIEHLKDIKRTSSFHDCVRRCISCEIGVSNSGDKPTVIFRNIAQNFPGEVLDGMDEILSQSLNVTNRKNKQNRMGFVTSEDAFTWVFVKHLSSENSVEALGSIFSFREKISNIVLWGTSLFEEKRETSRNKLVTICNNLGENPLRYSEPDIIIESDSEVVFVEVKLRSGNASEKNRDKFSKYLVPKLYVDETKAKDSGLYELVRNWTIGNIYASSKHFRLVNLGPEALFRTATSKDSELFKDAIGKSPDFVETSWESIFEKNEFKRQPDWFKKDLEMRFRLNRVGRGY